MINWVFIKLLKHYKQIARYSIIGILCFLVDISLLIILTKYTKIHYLFASVIGYLTGVFINYFLSISWVFSRRNLKKFWHIEFSIFMLIELIAMLFMSGSLYIFKGFLRVDLKLSKIFANFIAAIWNYIIKHIFLFKQHPEEKQLFIQERKQILSGNKEIKIFVNKNNF